MQKNTILSILIVTLLVVSGLAVLASDTASSNSPALATPNNTYSGPYNVTFVANGLENLFTGSENWSLMFWNVSAGGYQLYPVGNTGSMLVPGGTYYYIANDYFQTGFQSKDYVISTNMTIYVNFSTPQSINFTAGVNNNHTKWGVSMTNVLTSDVPYVSPSTYNSTLKAYVLPSSYIYNWFTTFNGSTASTGSSYLSVNQQNLTLRLPINSYSNVTFNEKGVEPGTRWFVKQLYGTVSDSVFVNSTGTSLNMSEMSGINTFVYGYWINSDPVYINSVSVDVGSTQSVNLAFPNLYMVTVNVNNLPSSTLYNAWGVQANFTVNGLSSSINFGTDVTNYVEFSIPNATAAVTPYIALNNNTGGNSTLYYVIYNTSAVQVNGANVSKTIKLSQLENVSLTVKGIPAGFWWSFMSAGSDFAGYESNGSYFNTAYFNAVNGTYNLFVQISYLGKTAEDIPVTVNVAGPTNVTVSLYNVSLGHPYPSTTLGFSVIQPGTLQQIANENPINNNEPAIVFLPNGTYIYYTAATIPGTGISNTYYQYNNNVTVSGSNVTLASQYPTQIYDVTVIVSGLPGNYTWEGSYTESGIGYYVNGIFSGSGNVTYTVGAPQGNFELYTYGLVVINSTVYAFNYTTFTVTSGTNTVYLNFEPYVYVNFVEYGLPAGTQWTASLNGTSSTSTSNTISIKTSASSVYAPINYTIGGVSGYVANPSNGSFYLVDYQGQNNPQYIIPVTFKPSGIQKNPFGVRTLDLSSNTLYSSSYLNNTVDVQTGPTVTDKSRGEIFATYTDFGANPTAYIKVINSTTYTVIKSIPLVPKMEVLAMVENYSSGMLYLGIVISDHPYVGSLNVVTDQFTAMPTAGIYINGFTYTPSGALYVATLNGMYTLNTETFAFSNFIPMELNYFGNPTTMIYSQLTHLIYVIGPDSNLYSVNPANNSVVGTFVYNGPYSYYFSFDGGVLDTTNNYIYVAVTGNPYYSNYATSSVVAFDISSGQFVSTYNIGEGIVDSAPVLNPQNSMLYVATGQQYSANESFSSAGFGILKQLNVNTGEIVNTYVAGVDSTYASLDPTTGDILVSSAASAGISIVTAGNYGHLSGAITGNGVTLLVNGYLVTPYNGAYNLSLAPGTYYVSAFGPNYAPVQKQVTVSAYQTTTSDISLSTQATYTVTGKVSPGTSSVTFNGLSAYVNQSGHYNIDIPLGNYTISVYSPGYFAYSENVHIIGPREFNFTLVKEPTPTTVLHLGNATVQGFNVQVANLTQVTGKFSFDFNSTGNGTLTIEVPLGDLSGSNLSDVLNSRVYIGGVQYTNFTVAVSANYTVILTVHGLKADPQLIWAYSPTVIVPSPSSPSFLSQYLLYIVVGIAAAVAIGAGTAIYYRKKGKN